MTVKYYHPTQEQRDRWRVSMRNWQDAQCVNKEYYDSIDRAMAALENPTILDAVKEMYRKGNRPYFEAFPDYLNPLKIEVPFRGGILKKYISTHEVFHLFARLGHTPQQEQWVISLHMAELYMDGTLVDHDGLREESITRSDIFRAQDKSYQHKPRSVPASNTRQAAIYFALGVYFLQKIQAFSQLGMANKSAAEQKAFAVAYSTSDDREPLPVTWGNYKVKGSMPYAMVTLSDAERQAITEIATGMKTPEQTAYPNRMARLDAVLREAQMKYDITPWVNRAVESLKQNPQAQALDPEKFKAARERRGAPTRD